MEELQEKLNKSQSRVFRYLKEHGSITSLEAIKALHETRLGARVWEMKKKGIPIQSKMIKVTNTYNETRYVKQYFFSEGEK